MVTVHGIYVTSLFFNPEKGQSTFLLKPEPGSCQDYVSEHGNIKVVGRFCLEQKNMLRFKQLLKEFWISLVFQFLPIHIPTIN